MPHDSTRSPPGRKSCSASWPASCPDCSSTGPTGSAAIRPGPPVEDGLDDVELRANWKRKRFPQYREVIRRIQSHGIRVNACFVVGLDGHGPGIFDAVYD